MGTKPKARGKPKTPQRKARGVKPTKGELSRLNVSTTSWERVFALRDSIRQHESEHKEARKEMSAIKETLNKAQLTKAEENKDAVKKWEIEKRIAKHRQGAKKALEDLLALIDAAEEGTLFEGETKGETNSRVRGGKGAKAAKDGNGADAGGDAGHQLKLAPGEKDADALKRDAGANKEAVG